MIPSCPGCRPIRSILRMSSSVTPSLLNSPPCTTKYRLRPSGDKMAFFADATGGWVAETRVDKGTARRRQYTLIPHEADACYLLAVNTCAKSCPARQQNSYMLGGRRTDFV